MFGHRHEAVGVRAPASNWNRLVRTGAPETPPIDLVAAKAHLKVETSGEDDTISQIVDDAIAQIDGAKGSGIALITQTWRMSLDHWRDGIVIPLRPVQAVVSVTYLDFAGIEQTLDPSLYDLDLDHEPVEIVPAFGVCFPAHKIGRGVIKVTFRAGFGDAADAVPADLIGALKLLIGHRYAHREAVVGVENRDSSAPLPLGVADVIARYNGGVVA